VPGHQGLRSEQLPGLRRGGVLMVLGRHPAVERKPQTTGGRHADGGGAGSPISGPSRQEDLTRRVLFGRTVRRSHDRRLPLLAVRCLTADLPGQGGSAAQKYRILTRTSEDRGVGADQPQSWHVGVTGAGPFDLAGGGIDGVHVCAVGAGQVCGVPGGAAAGTSRTRRPLRSPRMRSPGLLAGPHVIWSTSVRGVPRRRWRVP
jgi:hypothetical protein